MAGGLAAQMSSLNLGSRPQTVLRHFSGFCPAPPQAFAKHSRQQVFRSRTPLKVVAARVSGVECPNNKRVEFSIQYIYGIGPTTAQAIMEETGLGPKRMRELSEEELTLLREEVEKYTVEGDLRRFNSLNIRRLKEIQCYRGKRHIQNLPVRGQRTKTNSRTRKGKAKTVAGKKK